MRAAVGFALAALLPAVVAQQSKEKTSNDHKNLVTRSSISRLDPDFANIADDDNELLGAEVILTFAVDGDYENPKDGHLVMPYTGRRYTLAPDWDLRTIEVDAGPCTMFYSNTSDAEGNEWDETDKIKFGKEGGDFNFQDAEGTQRMKYLYCGIKDQGEKLLPETRCNKIVGGGSAAEKGHVCCRPPTEWADELWNLYEMEEYTGKAIDHFNEEGWPTNVMATFSTYDLTAYKPVSDMKKKLPYWEWNCGGINSNMCFSKDLSDWDACRADPRRRMLLQAMENFSSVIQTAQTHFNQEALYKSKFPWTDLCQKPDGKANPVSLFCSCHDPAQPYQDFVPSRGRECKGRVRCARRLPGQLMDYDWREYRGSHWYPPGSGQTDSHAQDAEAARSHWNRSQRHQQYHVPRWLGARTCHSRAFR